MAVNEGLSVMSVAVYKGTTVLRLEKCLIAQLNVSVLDF